MLINPLSSGYSSFVESKIPDRSTGIVGMSVKRMIGRLLVWCGLFSSLALCPAAIINIAFHNGYASLGGMTNRPAGQVVNTAIQFWNNVVSNDVTLTCSQFPLREADGTTNGALLSCRAGYGGVNNNGWASQDQDWAMMECWYGIVGSEFITISNLPAAYTANGYSVRIYGDCNELNRDMNYTLGGVTKTIYDRGTFAGTFIAGSNYVEFNHLTAPDFTIAGNASGRRSAINGLQISAGTVTPLPRIISFNASPAYAAPGSSVRLSWQTENAAALWMDAGIGDVTTATTNGQGSIMVSPTTTTIYTLSVSNATGIAQKSCRIFIGPPRPNVVVFIVDDMGWQDTSVPFWTNRTAFNTQYRTPGMETLAANGLKFNAAYACNVCSPTRISLLTGLNSARHRVTQWLAGYNSDGSTQSPSLMSPTNWNINGLGQASETAAGTWRTDVTLPRTLRDQGGYRTISIGKAHFGVAGLPGASPLTFGFDVSLAGNHRGSPGSYYGANTFGSGSAQVPDLNPYYGQDIFLTEALTLKALETVTQAVVEQTPFFLYLSHYAVHQPIVEDGRFSSNYTATVTDPIELKYSTMVEGMDKSLRDLLSHLNQLGVAENTLIVFCSDNGGLSASK